MASAWRTKQRKKSRVFSNVDPDPRRLDVVLAGTSNPQQPDRRNDDAASPNLMESACKCMHSRPRSFVTRTNLVVSFHLSVVFWC